MSFPGSARLFTLLCHSSSGHHPDDIPVLPDLYLFFVDDIMSNQYPTFQQAREAIRVWSETGLSARTRAKQAKIRGIDSKYINDLISFLSSIIFLFQLRL